MIITLSIDTSQLKLPAYVETIRKKLLLVGMQTAFNEAKSGIKKHSKTNRITLSLSHEKIPTGFKIYNDLQAAPHAIFVHDGTSPHLIPRYPPMPNPITGKKALRWVGKSGLPVFAKRVSHPGYKGDPWMEQAMNKAFEAMKNVKL
jgi:hypothetical protein